MASWKKPLRPRRRDRQSLDWAAKQGKVLIYKYYSSNSSDSTKELLIKISEEFTIRASAPTSFNDPFEFKVRVNLEADEEIARKRFILDNPGKSEMDFTNWWGQLRRPHDWHFEQRTRSGLLQSLGVSCFSSTCKNHLLWSHYAASHTGFCVGFDKSLMQDHADVVGHGAVEYKESSPVFNFFTENPDDFARKAVFHKSSEWEYEEEFRIVFNTPGIKSIPMEAVKEVILGCRASAKMKQYVRTKIDSSHVNYFQMVESLSSYSLEKMAVVKDVWPMTSHF
ncbi:DUF2971 domain-containing protein [Stenotrophomonas sp. GD03777]|uniref:DUF2971 domain-containing protein n=1 Tax=Stenotrophomonas TaxID=40323 RepID=UPI001660B44D|nr:MULTISPECIES: DUF2971 domain-containing protein [Stenotrophomonas]MDH1659889.1 DUF2971 domain-containing protein [Stenotrophomonas sp. GD03777]